jgi:hypothetical protein
VVPFVSEGGLSVYYLYFATKDLMEQREYKRHWTDFKKRKILLPSSELDKKFTQKVKSMFKLKLKFQKRNINLKRTRDLLLKKIF